MMPRIAVVATAAILLPLAALAAADKVSPALSTPGGFEMSLGGVVGERLRANLERWELRAPGSNPAMLQMYFDRDRLPDRNLLPWSGEFVGKYLSSAVLSYRLLHDARQKPNLDRIVNTLIESQGTDGYLGVFGPHDRFTGPNWDMWNHYWVIRGLLLYDEEFHSVAAVRAATRAADLIAAKYLNSGLHMTNDGSSGQMNYAVIHAFTMLYRKTSNPRYLEMAEWIVKEWDLPGAGQYMKMALAGKEMFEFPGNRWESLHDFLGMRDMYLLTGDSRYRDAFTRIWYSILKGDRHNTGGFTSGEQTTGNPYDTSAIETCCTVAWIDMSAAMLRLTGDSLVADEIELATLNGNLGGQAPSGDWWTYNTPMDGIKEASAHTINFQCRPGSPELNCCSVNAPRGAALIWDWALLRSDEGLVLNYYGPSTLQARTPGGQALTITETTEYPKAGGIGLKLTLAKPEKFALSLRIPGWSAKTRVSVNGTTAPTIKGQYLKLERQWKTGDAIEIGLDMSLHYWAGEKQMAGLTSIYRGPLLLAYDPAYNTLDPQAVPEVDARDITYEFSTAARGPQPWLLLSVKTPAGAIRLCDFASAGASGTVYRSWLPVRNVAPLEFDPARPVWANRPGVETAPRSMTVAAGLLGGNTPPAGSLKPKQFDASSFQVRIAAPASELPAYMEGMIGMHRRTLPRLFPAADASAKALLAGGRYLLGGSDEGWISEGTGRAGGVFVAAGIKSAADARAGDVVWVSYSPATYEKDIALVKELEARGAVAVAMGPKPASGAPGVKFWLDSYTGWDAPSNVTLMGNILSLWTLTGEMGATISREGKTLIFWKSFGMPGGSERADRYKGQVFHPDGRRMRPTARGEFARAYVDFIERMFAAIDAKEGAKLAAVAAEVKRRNDAGYLPPMMTNSHVMSYVPRADGQWFRYYTGGAEGVSAALGQNGLLLYLGYYHPLPEDVREAAHRARAKTIWIAVPRPDQKLDHEAYGDTFIPMHWNMGDACVTATDYDVKILPASGLAQLFVYDTLRRAVGK
jgi:uncharacterized protein